jgi:hypothetical protein
MSNELKLDRKPIGANLQWNPNQLITNYNYL